MKSESTDNQPKVSEKILGMSALLAETNQTHGPEPTNEELREHTHLSFDPGRRAEIESHIAHNPDIFLQFVAEAKKKQSTSVTTPRRSSFGEWIQSWSIASLFQPVPAFAGLAFVVVIGAFIFYMQEGSLDKVINPTRMAEDDSRLINADSWEVAVVQSGFNHPSAVEPQPNSIGYSLGESCDESECEPFLDQLTEFGSVLGRSYEDCNDSGLLSPETVVDIRGLHVTPPGRWNDSLDQLQSEVQRSPQSACGVVNQIVQPFIP